MIRRLQRVLVCWQVLIPGRPALPLPVAFLLLQRRRRCLGLLFEPLRQRHVFFLVEALLHRSRRRSCCARRVSTPAPSSAAQPATTAEATADGHLLLLRWRRVNRLGGRRVVSRLGESACRCICFGTLVLPDLGPVQHLPALLRHANSDQPEIELAPAGRRGFKRTVDRVVLGRVLPKLARHVLDVLPRTWVHATESTLVSAGDEFHRLQLLASAWKLDEVAWPALPSACTP